MTLHSLWTLAALLTIVTQCTAQNKIIPQSASSAFPACAVKCTVLNQAQTLCFPPSVASNTQLGYENCFCQSSYLQALYSTPDAICTAECQAESDRTLLQTWFRSFCANVGKGVDPLAAAISSSAAVTTPATAPTSSATVVTITSTAAIAPTSSASAGSAAAPKNSSWISTHWKWIVMIGVLIVGFTAITFFAVWLKKRHRRKVNDRRAGASGFPVENKEGRYGPGAATPELWGPHQHMAATEGYGYDNESNKHRKGRGFGRRSRSKSRGASASRKQALDNISTDDISPVPTTLQKKSSYRESSRNKALTDISEAPKR